MRRQRRGRRLTHIADAEREQETRQRRVLGLAERDDEVVGGLLAHPIERGERRAIETEQVRRRLHEVRVDQLLDDLLPEPFHIQRATRGEVTELLLALRHAAEARRAAGDGGIGVAGDSGSADRADRRQAHLAGIRRTPLGQHARDLRDHIARAAHDHRVADADILAYHLVHVVQRGVAHRDAADEHRCEPRHRRERTGAADLELDIAHGRERLVGGELVGDGPARRPRHET